MIKPQMLILS